MKMLNEELFSCTCIPPISKSDDGDGSVAHLGDMGITTQGKRERCSK